MPLLRIAALLCLLAPVWAADKPAAADPKSAPTAVLSQSAISSLFSRFFGKGAVSAQPAVPAAGEGKAAPAQQPQVKPLSGPRAEPDWGFTTGAFCSQSDPDFDGLRYSEQIPHCKRHATAHMKQAAAAHYGIPQADWPNYEFDHLIPLAIGGNNSIENLWPQPHGKPDGSNGKDRLEMKLYLQIKAGKIDQAEALRQIKLWFRSQSEIDTGGDVPQVPPGDNPAD